MPDEVGILGRPAELMTSIRVALLGKTVVGPAPMSWSSQWADLPQQGCGDRLLTVVDDDTNVDCGRRQRHIIAAPCCSVSGVFGALTNIDVPGVKKLAVHVASASQRPQANPRNQRGTPESVNLDEEQRSCVMIRDLTEHNRDTHGCNPWHLADALPSQPISAKC